MTKKKYNIFLLTLIGVIGIAAYSLLTKKTVRSGSLIIPPLDKGDYGVDNSNNDTTPPDYMDL